MTFFLSIKYMYVCVCVIVMVIVQYIHTAHCIMFASSMFVRSLAVSMLGHHRRCWPSIETALAERLVFVAVFLLSITPHSLIRPALQNQKAVSAHFTSKQILPFAFAELIVNPG